MALKWFDASANGDTSSKKPGGGFRLPSDHDWRLDRNAGLGAGAVCRNGERRMNSPTPYNLAGIYDGSMGSTLKDMATWTDLIGHAQLRSFVDGEGHFWLEQNASKQTKWAKLAREEHDVAWEFASRGGSYTGRMLIDGEIYTPSEATKKFLQTNNK
jgi:hypothetical protein